MENLSHQWWIMPSFSLLNGIFKSQLTIPTAGCKNLLCSIISPILGIARLLIYTDLVGVKCKFIQVLLCMLLITKAVDHSTSMQFLFKLFAQFSLEYILMYRKEFFCFRYSSCNFYVLQIFFLCLSFHFVFLPAMDRGLLSYYVRFFVVCLLYHMHIIPLQLKEKEYFLVHSVPLNLYKATLINGGNAPGWVGKHQMAFAGNLPQAECSFQCSVIPTLVNSYNFMAQALLYPPMKEFHFNSPADQLTALCSFPQKRISSYFCQELTFLRAFSCHCNIVGKVSQLWNYSHKGKTKNKPPTMSMSSHLWTILVIAQCLAKSLELP